MFLYRKTVVVTNFNRSFNLSTPSNPNVIPNVDQPERLGTHTDAPNDSSYHTARSWREMIVQESDNMTWAQAL